MKHALITGGAGFIGSNLSRRLLFDGWTVSILDSLISGSRNWIHPKATLLPFDLRYISSKDFRGWITPETVVFHLQGLADVRHGPDQIQEDLDQNLSTTHRLLEVCKNTGIKKFIFSSSAVVYGEPEVIPTPETYSGIQTSIYGAHKLAAEAEIQAYASYFGMQWLIFRFVSFLGPYYHHGVVYDFVRALQKDPTKLQILGDGHQAKSYLNVKDGIDGILMALESGRSGVFNLGHDSTMKVDAIANLIKSRIAPKAEKHWTGGERGWIGDARNVLLDTSKMKSLGWKPTISIQDSILETIEFLLHET